MSHLLAAQVVCGNECFTLHQSEDEAALIAMVLATLEKERSGTIGRVIHVKSGKIRFKTRKQAVC